LGGGKLDLSDRIDVLDQIYKIYDSFTAGLELACQKYCSTCCTRNVTMTSLEGYKIADHLIENSKTELLKKIKDESNKKSFQPKITTNKIADLCIQGKDIPDEEIDSSWGSCPLLINDECPIYTVRPFSCRCMVSKTNCIDKAEMDEFVLTVNNVFLQYIEHIDHQGFSGNFTDVLFFMESEDNRKSYGIKDLTNTGEELIKNMPMSILLIPPEHKNKIKPIINSLQTIKVRRPGQTTV
jgi:Fe-S-cluster containining protein